MKDLASMRKERGISKAELVRSLRRFDKRISLAVLNRYERGISIPTPIILRGMADIFGLPVAEVAGMTERRYIEEIKSGTVPAEPESLRVTSLIDALSTRHTAAKSRRDLAWELDMTGRKVSRTIEAARACGYTIIDTGAGRGFYLSDGLSEMESQYRKKLARMEAEYNALLPIRYRLQTEGRI